MNANTGYNNTVVDEDSGDVAERSSSSSGGGGGSIGIWYAGMPIFPIGAKIRCIHNDVVVARHNDFVFVGLLLHPGAK